MRVRGQGLKKMNNNHIYDEKMVNSKSTNRDEGSDSGKGDWIPWVEVGDETELLKT